MIKLLNEKLIELRGRPKAFKIEYRAFRGTKTKEVYISNTEELFKAYAHFNESWEYDIIAIYYEGQLINKKILHLILEIQKGRL